MPLIKARHFYGLIYTVFFLQGLSHTQKLYIEYQSEAQKVFYHKLWHPYGALWHHRYCGVFVMDPFMSWDLWIITLINVVDTAQDNIFKKSSWNNGFGTKLN